MVEQRTKVNVELPTELLTNFRKAAKEHELTVSALIRLLMKEYLKKKNVLIVAISTSGMKEYHFFRTLLVLVDVVCAM